MLVESRSKKTRQQMAWAFTFPLCSSMRFQEMAPNNSTGIRWQTPYLFSTKNCPSMTMNKIYCQMSCLSFLAPSLFTTNTMVKKLGAHQISYTPESVLCQGLQIQKCCLFLNIYSVLYTSIFSIQIFNFYVQHPRCVL